MNESKISNSGNEASGRKDFSIFFGIVMGFISEENDNVNRLSATVDNQNFFVIQVVDGSSTENVITVPFVNTSHGMDAPSEGESVLCVKTPLGIFILDRFSPYGYGVNYDPAVVLSSLISFNETPITSVEIDSPYFKKQSRDEVEPFKIKPYSFVQLGRNNQYLIFDHGYNLNSTSQEKKLLSEGSTIKLGFREQGLKSESGGDNCLVVTNEVNVKDYFRTKIREGFIKDIETFSDKSIGIQSDDIVLIGRKYLIFYSVDNMYFYGLNLLLEAKKKATIKASESIELTSPKTVINNEKMTEGIIESEKLLSINAKERFNVNSPSINLGKNATQPAVLGYEVVSMMKLLSDILTGLSTGGIITSQGPATLKPDLSQKIIKFKSFFTNRNSKYLSKTVKIKS